MAVLRIDIERALDEIVSQEEGMRFQGLAVVLGKMRWPELIARQRKKDFGLDAYASSSLASDGVGKGLAASITPTLKKVSGDVKSAIEAFPDLRSLLFVTPAKVGNADRKAWEDRVRNDHDVDLHILEREEIITLLLMPQNAFLRASFLGIDAEAGPEIAELTERVKRAAASVIRAWSRRTKGQPLIELDTVRIESSGAESSELMTLGQIDQALSTGRRVVLEGPAGQGKTTTLVQLAQRDRASGVPFIVELPAWISSRRSILEFIAGMPAFQAEGITSTDLARIQETEPFILLLNGWNEIAESNSAHADDALHELERDFPGAGIIVATRTHHLSPPLPGAVRLRLMHLRRAQRSAYLVARLGSGAADLRSRIEADVALEEMTRTPFILSEVAALFEEGASIPSFKVGVLAQVLRLHEERNEHRNALRASPIFGLQTDYLKALAVRMTGQGSVSLPEAEARSIVSGVVQHLVDAGQTELSGAAGILATLTAHHVLERVDYPAAAFQFQHQQIQEYYAALDVRSQLTRLISGDSRSVSDFLATYVNDPSWAEPLRMLAGAASGTQENAGRWLTADAGCRLVELALSVDIVFASELARLAGDEVWNDVRIAVCNQLRAAYASKRHSYRQYALAAMLATGRDDFSDVIVPILRGADRQARLHAYQIWPDMKVSSLGQDWGGEVRTWSDEARSDFVSALLHHRSDAQIASFAANDDSQAVKRAAADGLMWTGADDALVGVLDTMDSETFLDAVRGHADLIPASVRPRAVGALRELISVTPDPPTKIRAALDLVRLGESDLCNVIKEALSAIPGAQLHDVLNYYVQPAIEYLRLIEPDWISRWVAERVGDGYLYGHDYWLSLVGRVSQDVALSFAHRLETEDLSGCRYDGMIAIASTCSSPAFAAHVFSVIRSMRSAAVANVDANHQIIRQLESLFSALSPDHAGAGILSAVTIGNCDDVRLTTTLLSRVARSDLEPFHLSDVSVREGLRLYLKGSLSLVLAWDDFAGAEKAHLASSLAQVGAADDVTDLVALIRADIDRVRRGTAARAGGDMHSPLSNGASMTYASWHVASLVRLDPVGADDVLIDLLREPEYRSSAAEEMARAYLRTPEGAFDRLLRPNLIWTKRDGIVPAPAHDQRRDNLAKALNREMAHLRAERALGIAVVGLRSLASALAAVDGAGSAEAILSEISVQGRWDQYPRLDAAERLLMAGVVIPTEVAFALVDSILERTGEWLSESDRYLVLRSLAILPFTDDPAAAVDKIRDVVRARHISGHELRRVIPSLGQSRSEAAVDLLLEFASEEHTFEQCEEDIVNALAELDMRTSREVLLGFVDPDARLTPSAKIGRRQGVLVTRLAELAQRMPDVASRMHTLCQRELPEQNRQLLAHVMDRLGSQDPSILDLIDDKNPKPVPYGVWSHLESAFVERRPYEEAANTFTMHSRASNELRRRLFQMATGDSKRSRSALDLLGQIEVWRLEYGRAAGEPRHPDLTSGLPWPPVNA